MRSATGHASVVVGSPHVRASARDGVFPPDRDPLSISRWSDVAGGESAIIAVMPRMDSAMIHPILTYPDPVLRQRSEPIVRVDDGSRRLLDDMLETMYAAQGRGLAAVQIGVLRRAVVIDTDWKEGTPDPLFLVDPEITWASDGLATHEERCLSIPDTPRDVRRPGHVRVRYLDRDGIEQHRDMTGSLAMVVQHEIDHLNGVLIVDFAPAS